MHFQHEYEYPLYKRSVPEELQLIPKGVFGQHPNVYLQPKYHNQQNDYELKLVRVNEEGATCGEYYFQKDLHGWDKNCSCGILTSEYRNPIEYQQPIIPRQVHIRSFQSPHSSQINVCAAGMPSHSRTSIDDFPLWLKIYSRASVECDHKLHWHMFNIRDLYFFDNVLVRLYELDLEEIILWYKSYKNALLREMDKRLLIANQQRQRILLYKNS